MAKLPLQNAKAGWFCDRFPYRILQESILAVEKSLQLFHCKQYEIPLNPNKEKFWNNLF